MIYIRKVEKTDYDRLINIWEASVKATHFFLTAQTIQSLKSLVLKEYFPAVTLICSYDDKGKITGFAGLLDNKLEMLFLLPEEQRKGIGKALLTYAIDFFNVNSLDVNEQNPEAVAFYLKQGFKIDGRSSHDGQGNPYPLLHMSL